MIEQDVLKQFKIEMLNPYLSRYLDDWRFLAENTSRSGCVGLFLGNIPFKTDIIENLDNYLNNDQLSDIINFILSCLALSQKLQEGEND